jgi:hypothetical protein
VGNIASSNTARDEVQQREELKHHITPSLITNEWQLRLQ